MGEKLGVAVPLFAVFLVLLALTVTSFYLIGGRKGRRADTSSTQQESKLNWIVIGIGTLGVLGVLANLLAAFTFFTGIGSIWDVPLAATPTIEPVAAVTALPAPSPSAVPPVAVEMLPLRTYPDPSESFRLLIPVGWESKPKVRSPNEVAVQFLPPADQESYAAFIHINVVPMPVALSSTKLIDALKVSIVKNYGGLGITLMDPIIQTDGSVHLEWLYGSVSGTTTNPQSRGISWIWQADGQLAILSVAVPNAQYDELLDTITRIRQSCRVASPTP